MHRYLFMLISMFLICGSSPAQKYPGNDFIAPLDVPLKLSGTFGELRSNHFHSGIDLKTGEMEGLKVYAIADGYISRIKVQSGGYGKALYITHPNGYVSVYAHLNRYNSTIDDFVRKNQYANRSYEIDMYLPSGQFEVKQGEVVAFSGNSGRSGGPHLHFEIRSEADQKPVNPLLFSFQVNDNKAPLINVVKIYPSGPGSQVDGSFHAQDFYPEFNGKAYSFKNRDTISASGKILFGINTYDPFNGGLNKNGVYTIRLFVNDNLVYGHELSTFSFDETRYINSLIDYKEYKTRQRRVQKSFTDPNNKLGIYTKKNNRALVIDAGKRYKVKYEVSDIAGNVSEVVFWIRGEPPMTLSHGNKLNADEQVFSYEQGNSFNNKDIELYVPANALYDTVTFSYSKEVTKTGAFSAVHRIHYDYVPLHSWCKLSIRPDGLEEDLQQKALIVKLEEDGEYSACGGEMKDGKIMARVREFGNYCVMVDTLAPLIKPVNIHARKSLLAQHSIQVKITDELSGIESYNAYLNGKWILMEYDEKNDLLTYPFDNNLKDGENIFELVVTDERKNAATYKTTLLY